MKLLIVVSTLNTGGAQKIVSQITTHFPQDWEIDILLNSSDNVQFPYRGHIISLGLHNRNNNYSLGFQLLAFLSRLVKLATLKKENQYDICISFLASANFANILTGNKYCKTMVTVNNNMTLCGKYDPKYRIIVNPLIRLLYNKADIISALCYDVLDDLVENFGLDRNKLVTLYCSIDVEEIDSNINSFCLPESEREWISKDNTIITAGRYVEQKGQWHLIRAFSRVHEFCPQAKLVIFGSGELEEYYNELIDDYQLNDYIMLHPFSNQLVGYIANSAVFVMPSLYEGFGTALQEALACNTACVATDYISGGREQLDPDYNGPINKGYHEGAFGILTPECNNKTPNAYTPLDECELALSESLIRLLSDTSYRKRYASCTRSRAISFDINNIAKEWEDIIKSNT